MKKSHSILVLCFTVLLISCKPTLYFPDRVNTPGFSRAGQFSATAAIKPQNDGTDSASALKGHGVSASLDAGVSLTNHFAIIGSYRGLNKRGINEKGLTSEPGGIMTGKRYEIGASYFFVEPRHAVYEIYGGMGFGYINRDGYYNPEYNFRSRYNTYFLQTATGANWDYIRIRGGLRVTAYHYNTFNCAATPELRYNIASDNNSKNDVTRQVFTFVSPYLDISCGYKFIMFNLQQGFSAQVSGSRMYGVPFYTTIGINIMLGPGLWDQ